MEIYKINNINEFLKEGITNPSEIKGLKTNIENYIKTYFVPNIDFTLDMDLNLLVNPDGFKAVFFDQMAFLMPVAKLLNLDLSSISKEELPSYISVRANNRLNELSCIKSEEELMINFPTLSGIYQTRKEHIAKSVELEQECNRIKPATQADYIKGLKLKNYGISRGEHSNNLLVAPTFSFQAFMSAYQTDLERLVRYLKYMAMNVSQAAMPVSLMESIDEQKMDDFISELNQNQRRLK